MTACATSTQAHVIPELVKNITSDVGSENYVASIAQIPEDPNLSPQLLYRESQTLKDASTRYTIEEKIGYALHDLCLKHLPLLHSALLINIYIPYSHFSTILKSPFLSPRLQRYQATWLLLPIKFHLLPANLRLFEEQPITYDPETLKPLSTAVSKSSLQLPPTDSEFPIG